jgi:DNA-binding NarL/FixJ family response regulator
VQITRPVFLRAGFAFAAVGFQRYGEGVRHIHHYGGTPVKTDENKTSGIRAKAKPAGITVSIVEDDASVRSLLTEWIRGAAGFKCVGVHENAELALAALPQEKPAVVLMDINMPGISGIECVRLLKPKMLDTQFMMLTVYEDPDHIFKALSSGASGYMLKRTPKAELLAAVKDLCAGGSPMSSNIARKIVQSFQRFTSDLPSGADNLSPREREVLELLSRGHLYKEIADLLQIADGQHPHPPHLRKTARSLALAGHRQVQPPFRLSGARPGILLPEIFNGTIRRRKCCLDVVRIAD